MRKSDREITAHAEVLKLLDGCDTIRVAMHDEPYPYVVPLSFGWEQTADGLFIYFHCAKEGKKLDLIARDGRVCVEADTLHGYTDTGHSVTADYESAIAFGRAERVFGSELEHGLELLLKHCKVDGYSAHECAALNITAVVKISVESITAKRRFKH
ncbi:MAG TPA: pyridoxamine 5'-phosphate oxidase family protein [Candidatus Coproplasma avistercoris]|nr:pyridoxamine 5'-phosphate oxidase family protein [Candidatus Coproplasma avistercoris]